MTILCYYSCHLCGLTKIPVEVPVRGEEDVITWVTETARLMSRDHDARSPDCHPKELHDLMIPVSGADKIGGPSIS